MAVLVRCNVLTVLALLPVFLLGAVALLVGRDIALGPTDVGIAVAVMFTTSAAVAKWLGRFAQVLGAHRSMALSGALSATALTLCGFADSRSWLFGAFVVAGLANALAHPAVNRAIAEATPLHRQGVAFGIKQSSVPMATLLCGAAVPGIALVVGWRWAFWAFALVSVGSAISSLVWETPGEPAARPPGEPVAGVVSRIRLTGAEMNFVAVLAGVAMAAATSLGVFLVGTGMHLGLGASMAALLATLCSLVCITARIGIGWLVDRGGIRDGYLFIAALLTIGSVGYLLLGAGGTPAFVFGAFVAYGIGWSWTGLLQACVVKDNHGQVASATGKLTAGTSLGAATGPLLFGVVAESFSFSHAWVMAAALILAAGLSMGAWRMWLPRRGADAAG